MPRPYIHVYAIGRRATHASPLRRPGWMKTKVVLDATPIDVTVTDDRLIVALADGRELSAPLAWFPRLWTLSPSKVGNGGSSGADTAFTGPRLMRTSPSQACFGLLE